MATPKQRKKAKMVGRRVRGLWRVQFQCDHPDGTIWVCQAQGLDLDDTINRVCGRVAETMPDGVGA
jgi:hypothetical protein